REGIEDAVVIFDPPRKGSSEELISYICKKNPLRVVYISCNPDTLARDCTYFSKYGYITDEVTPFDLFPRTGHVESVVCLTRQTN
ncbi:MAG: 23S rRNA (uracil-5-)-methyltransferase RumA, partial [Clostridia bacterium]|nr:23S rRNA (uracil-5-)-methyltransferase RumA [Clostridia bacterium]